MFFVGDRGACVPLLPHAALAPLCPSHDGAGMLHVNLAWGTGEHHYPTETHFEKDRHTVAHLVAILPLFDRVLE